ncbi:hypothetical protein [Endozoicomonas sp. SCSIO W0465]|nr:hypothetical protein [Endozoicomonas sp. SCSIO W0465]USE35448.1 hypothetical protein MJO57_25655 [Endozoicomonas sp. SCSIO W0465]
MKSAVCNTKRAISNTDKTEKKNDSSLKRTTFLLEMENLYQSRCLRGF